MITAPWTPGVPASWVTGDEVYGADPRLAGCLEGRSIGYVLAIAGNRRLRPAHRPPRSSLSPTPAGLAGPLGLRRRARHLSSASLSRARTGRGRGGR